jgi:hypothetical protein
MDVMEGQRQPEIQVDSSQPADGERSFHSFNDLPPEIRLEVWALNPPSPRLVRVHYDVHIGKFWTTTPSPANLLVCAESRHEAEKKWPLRFGTRGHLPTVRTNLDIDTIQLSWDPLRLRAVSKEDLSGITSLEIGGIELQRASAETILLSILTMANLKDFSIISPALHAAYRYALNQHLVHPLAAAIQQEHWLMHARKLSYEERRNRAFRQHTEVTRCFRTWAREHKDCQLPRLRLLLLELDGSRAGPFFWKP